MGAQNPRRRCRHQKVDRLPGSDPRAQIGGRELQARHRDARDAPSVGRRERRRFAVDDRQGRPARADRRRGATWGDPPRRRCPRRGTARARATSALRPCRSCRWGRHARARSARARSLRCRRSRQPTSRNALLPARSPARASATGRGPRLPAPGRGRAGVRAADASIRWPTCTGSKVPPRIPTRSRRVGSAAFGALGDTRRFYGERCVKGSLREDANLRRRSLPS